MNKYYIWLSKLQTLTARDKLLLLKKYNISDLWKLDKSQVQEVLHSFNKINEFFDITKRKNVEFDIEYCKKNKIKLITIHDKIYPTNLKNMYDAPILLYAMGNVDILNYFSFAIVGTRNPSQYGIQMARNFSYMLSKNNFNIISGLAKGIDYYAHEGALKANGKTIGVIGTGVDKIYPKENAKLYKKIIEEDGLILTEFQIRK